MADTPTGETVTPEAPSNAPSTVAAPKQDNSNVDVEAAKKEAEQARIRANQLQNELDKIKADNQAVETKQLEEKEEFKKLYEQTQTRLAEVEADQKAREQKAALAADTEKALGEYPQAVVDIARTAGLSLSDDSDEAIAALKEKLDAIKGKVAPDAKPVASNPNQPTPAESDKSELIQRMRGGDKTATTEYIRNMPAVQAWKERAAQGLS